MKLDYLLITATKLEQSRILTGLEVAGTDCPQGRPWHYGSLSGRNVLLVEGGVGQVNTASALTLALARHEPDIVLQFGVGGAYVRSGLAVGDLAIATEECYGDTGVLTTGGWIDLGEMGFPVLPVRTDDHGNTLRQALYNRIPLDSTRVDGTRQYLASELNVEGSHKTVAGPFVTVAQCSGIQAAGDTLAGRFGGICENMEGAAAAHVSAAYGVPFVEVRAISNLVVDRDLSQWDLPLAACRCQEAVEVIVAQGVQ